MTSGRPWFVLVAGINGAGKSTFAQNYETLRVLLQARGPEIEVINPDLVTREILRILIDSGHGLLGVNLCQNSHGSGLIVCEGERGPGSRPVDTGSGSGPAQSVASSADGTQLVAVGHNGIYTSSDAGATWVQRQTTPWRAVASSSDGTKLVAVGPEGIYTSSDSGTTWEDRRLHQDTQAVASSADGTKLVAIGDSGWSSEDGGVTWAHGGVGVGHDDCVSVASSADGRLLVAACPPSLMMSLDSGRTWNPRGPRADWRYAAISSDGSKLAAVSDDRLYTSTGPVGYTTPDSGGLLGEFGTSVELVYAGNGTFVLGDALGALSAF